MQLTFSFTNCDPPQFYLKIALKSLEIAESSHVILKAAATPGQGWKVTLMQYNAIYHISYIMIYIE